MGKEQAFEPDGIPPHVNLFFARFGIEERRRQVLPESAGNVVPAIQSGLEPTWVSTDRGLDGEPIFSHKKPAGEVVFEIAKVGREIAAHVASRTATYVRDHIPRRE